MSPEQYPQMTQMNADFQTEDREGREEVNSLRAQLEAARELAAEWDRVAKYLPREISDAVKTCADRLQNVAGAPTDQAKFAREALQWIEQWGPEARDHWQIPQAAASELRSLLARINAM
jgi:hypothetical protein